MFGSKKWSAPVTDWFRSWHGAPTDPKWLGIAKRAGVAPGIAVSVAWALMDRASQAEDRGSIAGYDADGLACFFGCETEQVDSIVAAMTDKGMIAGGRFTNWEKRQPKREDDSAQRVREHRERNRQQRNTPVTPCNAPEADTDTEIDTTPSGVVRAPLENLDELRAKLIEACGETNIHGHGTRDLSAIVGLIGGGADLETDILPTIRAKSLRLKRPAGSWAYFTNAIRDAHNSRIDAGKGLAKPAARQTRPDRELSSSEMRERWRKTLEFARPREIWHSHVFGPPPGRPGCRCPPDLLTERDLRLDWHETKPEAA